MIKFVVCEDKVDKFVFHEYRNAEASRISWYHVKDLANLVEKDFSERNIVFMMVSCLENPFNFDKEVVSHGKVN